MENQYSKEKTQATIWAQQPINKLYIIFIHISTHIINNVYTHTHGYIYTRIAIGILHIFITFLENRYSHILVSLKKCFFKSGETLTG